MFVPSASDTDFATEARSVLPSLSRCAKLGDIEGLLTAIEACGGGAALGGGGAGISALMHASRSGHEEAVACLIDARAPVDTRSERGCTALTLAAEAGHAAVVRALVDGGAD
eukprot:3382207-Pleurochrysis_carterae.AAC.1